MNISQSLQKCDRTKDLSVLSEKLRDTGCIVVVGMGGMGKSVLAAGLRRNMDDLPEYTGRLILVKCREAWTSTDFYSEISNTLNQAFGIKISDQLTEPVPEIVKILDTHAIILFLDDFYLAENEETLKLIAEARKLKKGRLLTFTRRKPDLDPMISLDVYQHMLKGLSAGETKTMVSGILDFHGRKSDLGELSSEIHRITNGHPFSIKVMTGLLISGRLTGDELRSDLDVFREHIESYLIDSVWKCLDEQDRHCLSLLSIVRLPLVIDLVAQACENQAASLDVLRNWCMLEQDIHGKVWVHDLVKEFVRGLYKQEDQTYLHRLAAETIKNNAGADTELLSEAYYHFVQCKDLEQAEQALVRLCDVNLFLSTHKRRILHIIENARDRLNISNSQIEFHYVRSMIDGDLVSKAEKRIKNFSGWQRQMLLAELYNEKYQYEKARQNYHKSQEACPEDEIKLYLQMKEALLTGYSGQENKAVEMFAGMVVEHDLSSYELMESLYYHYYTNALLLAANDTKALENCEKAEKLFKVLNAKGRQQEVLYYRCICLTNLNRLEEAEIAIRKAIDLSQETGDFRHMATCYNSLGHLLYNKKQYNDSIDAYKRVIELAQPLLRFNIMAYVCSRIGNIYARIDNMKLAESYFERSQLYLEQTNDKHTKSNVISAYAPFLVISGRIQEAMNILIEVLDELKNPRIRADFLHVLSTAYRLNGQNEEAEEARKEYFSMIHGLPQSTQDFIYNKHSWFDDRVKDFGKKVMVHISGRIPELISRDKISEFLEKSAKFDIYADFINKTVHVDGIETSLSKRRRLMRLFQEITLKPDVPKKISDLYMTVWEREFDYSLDHNTFRANISRLRKILCKNDINRFIQADEAGRSYMLSKAIRFCLIYEP